MELKIEMAPLEGATTVFFRRVQSRHFTRPVRYYTPFISPTADHIFTSRELNELLPQANDPLPVVPQLIGHNADDFLWAARELKAMGYDEVNLNLGCPSGTVTKKKKGAGLLSETAMLTDFLDRIFTGSPVDISIKTRVGRRELAEAEPLAELFSRYPVSRLIVHPRLERDFYGGEVSMQAFEHFRKRMPEKICYNGDLFNRVSIAEFQRLNSGVGTVMCGRGFVANPKLAGEAAGEAPLSLGEFTEFYNDFFEVTAARLNTEKQLLLHMKEYWTYWKGCFADPDDRFRKLFKSKTAAEYRTAVHGILTGCEMNDPAGFSRTGTK